MTASISGANQSKKELPAQLVQRYSDIGHTVHQDTNLAQSRAQQIPLMDFAPRSRSAAELTAIAQWVMAIAND